MDAKEIEQNLIDYINAHEGIISNLGKLKFTNSDRIGQGGNGLVYLATINEKEIAIKLQLWQGAFAWSILCTISMSAKNRQRQRSSTSIRSGGTAHGTPIQYSNIGPMDK